jgi:hypothetical protein
MLLFDRKPLMYWDDADPVGGTVETEETEVEEEDTEFNAAFEEWKQRMEALGAELDSKGEFVRWKQSGLGPQTTQTTEDDDDEDDVDKKIDKRLQQINQVNRPTNVSNIVTRIASAEPKLARYTKMVQQALEQDPNYPLDDASVRGLFVLFRGQSADLEIAEAVKGAKKGTSEKHDAAVGALSDGGPGKGSGATKNAAITAEITEYAKAWNLDPQKYANDLRDYRASKH